MLTVHKKNVRRLVSIGTDTLQKLI